MVSAGLTLIFGMMGVLNFAHTSFYMVGAYLAYSLEKVLGFWPAIIISPLIVGVLGALVERYLLRRVHRYGHGHQLLLTFGVSFIIAEVIKLFYGNYPVNYRVPDSLSFSAFSVFGARSEEHTSELQSLMRISYAVFCLKKKKTSHHTNNKMITHTTKHKLNTSTRYKVHQQY